jgi:hypothetical protein
VSELYLGSDASLCGRQTCGCRPQDPSAGSTWRERAADQSEPPTRCDSNRILQAEKTAGTFFRPRFPITQVVEPTGVGLGLADFDH